MARPLWKGNISFGLVTIPVNLYSATRRDELRFRQLDRADNQPVREKRVNAETGREVPWDDVVKGYEYEKGAFVVLEPEDFEKANVRATQTIDIMQAVPRDAVPPQYFESPMFVVPTKAGMKPYHLLRETLLRTDRVAIAMVVMRGRQHLTALIPDEEMLTLEMLRFAHELKGAEELDAGDLLEEPELRQNELELAEQLVATLDAPWEPGQYRDDYRDDLLKLIEEKAKAGGVPVPAMNVPERPQGGQVVDMMELLKRSVGEAKGRKKAAGGGDGTAADDGERKRSSRKRAAG
jgi:DNA end-binding protein Ku